MSKNIDSKIIKEFVKDCYLNSYRTVNQIAIILTQDMNKLEGLINEEFPDHKSIIYSSKSKPIENDIMNSIKRGHLTFVFIDNLIDKNSFYTLEKIKTEGIIDTNTNTTKMNQGHIIFIVGSRENLENQHGNLINLGGNFLDLT